MSKASTIAIAVGILAVVLTALVRLMGYRRD